MTHVLTCSRKQSIMNQSKDPLAATTIVCLEETITNLPLSSHFLWFGWGSLNNIKYYFAWFKMFSKSIMLYMLLWYLIFSLTLCLWDPSKLGCAVCMHFRCYILLKTKPQFIHLFILQLWDSWAVSMFVCI